MNFERLPPADYCQTFSDYAPFPFAIFLEKREGEREEEEE